MLYGADEKVVTTTNDGDRHPAFMYLVLFRKGSWIACLGVLRKYRLSAVIRVYCIQLQDANKSKRKGIYLVEHGDNFICLSL